LLNHDHLLAAFASRFHFLLGASFKRALALSLGPHALNCVHHVGLLGQERVAEIRRPLDIAGQPLNYIRKRCHCLDARIPRLFCYRIGQRLVL